MIAKELAAEQTNEEDRAYRGSRFSEVRQALWANPYQNIWGGKGEPKLPVYPVSFGGVVGGGCPFSPSFFRRASIRTVDSAADLRWGTRQKGYRRLLHPNGVCLTGTWEITEPTPYSGYFAQGQKALIIGRYSTCCTETRRGFTRSLAMVGKLFPTTNPDHTELLRTANFITQQDIGGDRSNYINDAELLNAPNVTLFRRGLGFPVLVVTGLVFGKIDKQPSMRQLYPIAELGANPNDTRAPLFMRLRVATDQPRVEGEQLDFRDEVMSHIFDPGDPTPKRRLTFDIETTNDGRTTGISGFERRTFQNWRRIGRIVFDDAVISYNGDFVIHFNHPTWREDTNDPTTATRENERKVR